MRWWNLVVNSSSDNSTPEAHRGILSFCLVVGPLSGKSVAWNQIQIIHPEAYRQIVDRPYRAIRQVDVIAC